MIVAAGALTNREPNDIMRVVEDDMAKHGLSKSKFVAGWQCHKMLWWRVHEPDAPELVPDDALQAVFNRGSNVGEVARTYVPGGVLIDFPHDQIDRKVQATAEAIAAGAQAIYEASFIAAGVFVAVDILEKTGRGWNLIEVKSTTTAKPQHEPDVAIQTYVLEKAGLKIKRSELMHLNRACRYPDLSNLFARDDLTAAARALLPQVPKEIKAQLRMLDGPMPDIAAGDHCTDPYECPFMARCHPKLPPHHLSTLYRLRKDKMAELEATGLHTIFDLPADYRLSAVASRQRTAVLANRLVVEAGLQSALAQWKMPIAFLDFETIAPAIPVWNGCRPYDPVPVQFSCHVLDADGSVRHAAWLADGPGDPRKELVSHVVDAVKGAKVILAWNASFERRCLNDVKACMPQFARKIDGVVKRIDDLLPVVRDNVYHPDFGGSFSIKAVLPALVPGMGYGGLEIAEGQVASDALESMLLGGDGMSTEQKAHLREALLHYCELDTLAMVKLNQKLHELV